MKRVTNVTILVTLAVSLVVLDSRYISAKVDPSAPRPISTFEVGS